MDDLKKSEKFEWYNHHEEAFNKLKNIISIHLELKHYDYKQDIVLSTDASKDDMEVALALIHRFKDVSLGSIMHFAAMFNTAEKNNSQIEKEARAFIFGQRRSHFYITDRRITVHDNHKPLLAIFGIWNYSVHSIQKSTKMS